MPGHTATLAHEVVRAAEIDEARLIQEAMLPSESLRGYNFEFAHRCRPVGEVGGDFLDYFLLDDKKVGFYLGDVVGKGLPAAMYAALAVGALRGMHKTGAEPCTVLEVLNDRLRMRVMPGRYCSVLYGVFDPKTLELRIASAGMPRPLLVSTAGCEEFGDGGLPSGLFESVKYDQVAVTLSRGDAVLFISDGLTDARNAEDEDFGHQQLDSTCKSLAGLAAEQALDGLFAAADSFADGSQVDDMTAAVLRVPPAP